VLNTYDAEGQLKEVGRASIPNTAGVDTVYTTWEYDGAGRKVSETNVFDDKDTTSFDVAGNPEWTITRRRDTLRTRHDIRGRLLERIVPPDTTAGECLHEFETTGCETAFPFYPNYGQALLIPESITRFRYDAAGRLAHATNDDAEIGRSYYRNGQLKTDTLRIRSVDRATIEMAKVLSHEYDLAGRETRLAEGTNNIDYTYDDLGYGGLQTVADPSGNLFSFTYDVAGRLRLKTVAPTALGAVSVRDTMIYDADSRLVARIEKRISSGVTTTLHGDAMTYDARGKVVAFTSNAPERTGRIREAAFRYSGLGALINDAITRDGLGFGRRRPSRPTRWGTAAGISVRISASRGRRTRRCRERITTWTTAWSPCGPIFRTRSSVGRRCGQTRPVTRTTPRATSSRSSAHSSVWTTTTPPKWTC
jgi:YD repeat-containing protein